MRGRMLFALSAAGALAAAAATLTPPTRGLSRQEPARIDDEKMSRQRKRWLQKQARKAMRRHRK